MRKTRTTLLTAALALQAAGVAADNLACNGTGMDWYINMVGETPCQTYQKLRQICNSQYTVGVQNPNTPPDACTDQVSSCCCNTIAFSLSMLCLNCQQNISTGSGFDAGAGAYQDYLGSCSGPQSFKLPTDIQTAVCNEPIKIDDDIYTNGWSDGSWFYVFTRDTIIKDNLVANNNSFTHCASTTINTSKSSSSSQSQTSKTSSQTSSKTSSTSSPDSLTTTKKKLASGAIAGIAVGAVIIGLVALIAAWWFCCRGRKRDLRAGVLEEPFGGMRESRDRGTRHGAVDQSLVPHAYTYSDEPSANDTSANHYDPSANNSAYFSPPRSEGSTSSAPGFAGLGAGTAGGYAAGVHDSESTGPLTPRRGFHTAGQPSTDSSVSLPQSHSAAGTAAGTASLSGSSGRGADRGGRQAGPLPRKRADRNPPSVAGSGAGSGANAATTSGRGRADSAEPFLEEEEHEPWLDVDAGSQRHRDGGPVSDVALGRSPSGRLPPAYGEQL